MSYRYLRFREIFGGYGRESGRIRATALETEASTYDWWKNRYEWLAASRLASKKVLRVKRSAVKNLPSCYADKSQYDRNLMAGQRLWKAFSTVCIARWKTARMGRLLASGW